MFAIPMIVRRPRSPAAEAFSNGSLNGRTVEVSISGFGTYDFAMTVDGDSASPIQRNPRLWELEVANSDDNVTVAWTVTEGAIVSAGSIVVPPNQSVPGQFGADDWSLADDAEPATVPGAFGESDWTLTEEAVTASVPDAFDAGDWVLEVITNDPPPDPGDGSLTAPQSVAAEVVDDRTVTVTWTAPASGTPTSYEVDWSPDQTTWTTVTGQTSPANIGPLPIGGQTYFFRVRARNATTSATSAAVSEATHVRAYGIGAEWNKTVSEVLSRGTHPNETYIREVLFRGNSLGRPAGENWVGFFSRDYTYPVYKASDSGGNFATVSAADGNFRSGQIPWNPDWTIPGGTDRQFIVINEATGEEWNGFQVSYNAGTDTLSAARCNRITVNPDGTGGAADYRTKTSGFRQSRGCGIQYLAMLIRPEEIQQGKIYHALSCVMRRSGFRYYSDPATKGERFPGNESDNGIPQGTRFYLDVTNGEIDAYLARWTNVSTAGKATMKIVYQAMRDYGCIATDQGGNNHIQFQHDASTDWTPYGMDVVTNARLDGTTREWPRDAIDYLITNSSKIKVTRPADGVLHYYERASDSPARSPVALNGIHQGELITTIGQPLIERSGNTLTLTRRGQFFGANPVTIGTPEWLRQGSTTVLGTGTTYNTSGVSGTYFCRERASNANGTTLFNSNSITI